MVSTTKTIVSRSAYEAPACKLYSIIVESVIAGSKDGIPDINDPIDDSGAWG